MEEGRIEVSSLEELIRILEDVKPGNVITVTVVTAAEEKDGEDGKI